MEENGGKKEDEKKRWLFADEVLSELRAENYSKRKKKKATFYWYID